MRMIWKRYFFFEQLKVLFLFLLSFYFLYVMIDYSTHSKVFQGAKISFFQIMLYYFFQFSKRADILLPFALLISTIKVLTTSNLRLEIIALATSGISLKRLLNPFLLLALCAIGLLYANFQFLQPLAVSRINDFENTHFKSSSKIKAKERVNSLQLEDNTVLIYQKFDRKTDAFFDVYWLKNFDQIYRIQSLYPYANIPYGNTVEILNRTAGGDIIKTDMQQQMHFPEMLFDTKTLFSAVHTPQEQSLTQLMYHLRWKKVRKKLNHFEAAIQTFLFYRLTIPLLCILAVLAPAPYCLRFGRTLSVFIIYAFSVVGMLSVFTIVNSSVILAESQILPPLWAIILPQFCFFLLIGYKYVKI
ncbi:MAG: hypothetical protein S4CHLAM123_14890 [Chlamydiales bacterium]|nr:hypothetical protein [Chlamydiales bacterium]